MDNTPAAMDRHLDVIQCQEGEVFIFLVFLKYFKTMHGVFENRKAEKSKDRDILLLIPLCFVIPVGQQHMCQC